EINALFCLSLFVRKNFRTADDPICNAPQRTRFAAEEVANIVPEAAIPFFPGVANETADLVQARGIPGLGDELRACQGRIRFDVPEYRRIGQWLSRVVSRKDGCQVEAKSVHVHFRDPVA